MRIGLARYGLLLSSALRPIASWRAILRMPRLTVVKIGLANADCDGIYAIFTSSSRLDRAMVTINATMAIKSAENTPTYL